jgi:hypothetical protein
MRAAVRDSKVLQNTIKACVDIVHFSITMEFWIRTPSTKEPGVQLADMSQLILTSSLRKGGATNTRPCKQTHRNPKAFPQGLESTTLSATWK